jgi:hypothetical protein
MKIHAAHLQCSTVYANHGGKLTRRMLQCSFVGHAERLLQQGVDDLNRPKT